MSYPNPNHFPYGAQDPEAWRKEAYGKNRLRRVGVFLGVTAAAAAIGVGSFLHLSSPNAAATIHPAETSTSSEYDGAIDDPSTEAELAEGGVVYPPEREYPQPTVETARIDLADIDSMEDVPTAFAEKLSEWLMAGATVETYNDYMASDLDIYEFTDRLAEENKLIYQEALFGITEEGGGFYSHEVADLMKDANARALERFLTSVGNEWEPQITEAYSARFTVVNNTIEEAYALSNGTFALQLETNGENAMSPDRGYEEPLGGDGNRITLTADIWPINVNGEALYGENKFDEDGSIRFDKVSVSSEAPNA